jgi:hypothetical protein
MSAKSVFKIGFLSVIAATGLFAGSISFAADAPVATVAKPAVSDHFRVKVIQDGRWQAVDSKGNVYLLTEVKNNQACEARGHSYTQSMSH